MVMTTDGAARPVKHCNAYSGNEGQQLLLDDDGMLISASDVRRAGEAALESVVSRNRHLRHRRNSKACALASTCDWPRQLDKLSLPRRRCILCVGACRGGDMPFRRRGVRKYDVLRGMLYK